MNTLFFELVGLKRFYVKEHYILTKHSQNWIHVKNLLDTPIWTSAKSRWDDKNVFHEDKKVENLNEKEFVEEIKKNRLTYGTLLKAFGDLIIEAGRELHFPSAIRNKFEENAKKEYHKISKYINQDDWPTSYKDKEEIFEKTKKQYWKRYEKLFHKKGFEVIGAVKSLNSWLNKATNNSAVFIKKVGEDYKLLIYYARDKKGRIEYFCSDANKVEFAKFVTEKRIELNDLRKEFENNIVGLQTLEEVLTPPPKLKKGFFPIGGPYKYNFVNGWVLRRHGVIGTIKNAIDKNFNEVPFLIGDSASGKTVIARNVGYELQKKGWQVYHIYGYYVKNQIPEISNGIKYLENISNKSLIIFEDIHKDSWNFSPILHKLTNQHLKTRFLLTGRTSFDIFLTQRKKNIFEKCNTIELIKEHFSHLAKSIISNYIQNQKGNSAKDFDKLTLNLHDEMIKLSDGNFWILAYLLESWKPGERIDIKNVYDYIGADLEDLKKEFWEKYDLRDVDTILLTLSVFSMFELLFPDIFFNAKKGYIPVSQDTLKKLTKYGEISCVKGSRRTYYSISHSTLAELYIKTCIIGGNKTRYSYLLSSIIDLLEEHKFSVKIDDFLPELLKFVMRLTPDSSVMGMVLKISLFELKHRVICNEDKNVSSIGQGDKVDRSVTLFRLFQDKSFFRLLIKALNNTDNLAELGVCLFTFSVSTGMYYCDNILKDLDCKKLTQKIEKNIDKRPQDVILCLDGLCKVDIIEKEELIDPFFNELNHFTLKKIISYVNKSQLSGGESLPFYFFMKDHGWNTKLINRALGGIKNTDDLNSILLYIKIVKKGVDMGLAKSVEVQKEGKKDSVDVMDFLRNQLLAEDLMLFKFRKNNIVEISTFFYLNRKYMREKISKNKEFIDNLLPILISKINVEQEFYYIILLITEFSIAGKNGKDLALRIINALKDEKWFNNTIAYSKNAGIFYYLPYEKYEVKFAAEKIGLQKNIKTVP